MTEEASNADATTSGSQDGAMVYEAEDEDEYRPARAMPDPGQPSREERRLHNLYTYPFDHGATHAYKEEAGIYTTAESQTRAQFRA